MMQSPSSAILKKMFDLLNKSLFHYSVQHPFQDYFIHIETSQSVGGAKREYPGKTT